jgi:hypothetical protein
MFHTVAYESTASLAALTAITPVPDPTVAVIGNDIRIPTQIPNILAADFMINSAAGTPRAQVVTPSLRAIFPLDCSNITNGLIFSGQATLLNLWYTPVQLVGLEPMDVFMQNGAAVVNRAVIWLGDGATKQTTGKIYSIRATASATLATATWVNSGALTFASTLPTGHYQLVGLRSLSANQVAARVFFVGYPWRPGVTAAATEAGGEWFLFRYGQIGVWGEFDNTVPPTVDFLGVTDTAEVLYMDLIKTS